MKTPVPVRKTVLETILEWSRDRPDWQRDALRRIVSNGHVDATDAQELVELCKLGKGDRSVTLKAVPLDKGQLPANPGQGAAVSLVSIADVDGVNNLAPGQTLPLGQSGLRIIYGNNGTGKSGYARILKRACRARHSGKIEPNIYSQRTPARASATLTYSIGGVQQPPEKWQDADYPHATLSAVSFFDSQCGSVLIKDKTEVAFRPFGLDVPDELASACQSVREILVAELEKLEAARNPIFSSPAWKPTTAVGKSLAALKHDADLKQIERLGDLSDKERARLEHLTADLSKDPSKAVAEQRLKADNLKRLLDTVAVIEEKTSDKVLTSVVSAHQDAKRKRETARLAAEKAFSREPLKGVGGDVWRLLWDAARRYSTQVVYERRPFPSVEDDSVCVLCQQPLGDDARDRMERFEQFIQEDTERQAREAEQISTNVRQVLTDALLGTLPLKASLQAVAIQDAELARQTRRFFASARLRRFALLRDLNKSQEVRTPAFAPNPKKDLAKIETASRQYATELQNSATTDERKKLEAELAELKDRALLGGMIKAVKDEVERLKSIRFLDRCIDDTTTNAITILGNRIADTVITPKLRDRFQGEIAKLGADQVRVEIVRSGGKYGSPQYQVRLFAKPEAKVQDILSEGEKTCVALAAFLTELATASHKSALVFDDPVSSLDHRWRAQVAKRLVQESEHRQVIVFTHDLIFVNDILDMAEENRLPAGCTTVSRGPAGAGVVTDGLPWVGKSVEDRIDKLEKAARDAKKLYDTSQEAEYGKEAARIYNLLRGSWERALEEIAFQRIVQRHRDYNQPEKAEKGERPHGTGL